MDTITASLGRLLELIPTGAAIAAVIVAAIILRALFLRRFGTLPGRKFRLHLILLVLYILGVIIVILTLPINDATKVSC